MAITDEYGYVESPDERDYLATPPAGPVVAPTPITGTTTPPPAPVDNWGGKNPIDPAYIRSVIAQWAAMPGADPSLGKDPDYWLKRILETGGLRADNLKYWQDASVGPTAFFNNPDRETGGNGNPGGLANDTRQYDDDWFSQNTPAPASYAQLTRPDSLGTYTPGQWNETFQAPTMADLEADPGFMASEAAVRRGLERGAAAKGSILSGGFVGRTVPRAMAEHTSGAYKDLVGRAFDTYQSKYGAFMGNEALKAGARGINESAFQTDSANNLNTYNTRYKSYRDTIGDSFDLARLGLDAALGSRY